MENKQKLIEDLKILDISEVEKITTRFVTMKFRRLAKQRHPDKAGGQKESFQELQEAYKRIIKYLEENMEEEAEYEEDYERDFFMKNNIMREYSTSFVIYIQNEMASKWKDILKRHLEIHKSDKCRIIFKTGQITLTLYEKPKKDPRSKIHIQSGNQERNLEFIIDKLALFYKEVCLLKPVETPSPALEIQKSICGNCGKQFKDKRGVKQHMLRIHVQKIKRIETDRECITLEESSPSSPEVTSQESSVNNSVINVLQTANETGSTSTPSQPTQEENKESKKDDENFIKGLIGSLISHCGEDNAVSNNYQCGECGKTFNESENVEKHMKISHVEEGCLACLTYKREEEKLRMKIQESSQEIEVLKKLINEKSEAMEILKEQNNNLTKKNVSMTKEIRTHELALSECLYEKAELKKEVNAKSETVNETIKLNTLLKEEIKVKDDIIKALSENDTEIPESKTKDKDDETNIKSATKNSSETEKHFECNDCDFTTPVKSHLMGHIIEHTSQYQCQRQGCKQTFKTYSDLDNHIDKDHENRAPKEFICQTCNLYFKAKYELRLHNQKKHASTDTVECQKCGRVFETKNDFKNHDVYQCEQMFTRVPEKVCRYFADGGCTKGNMCKFPHKRQINDKPVIPECRNGAQCHYLKRGACVFSHWGAGGQKRNQRAHKTSSGSTKECRKGADCEYFQRGICKFNHRKRGNQSNRYNQSYNGRSWCKFLEDCFRVPNCSFKHYDEDFPELPTVKNPPIGVSLWSQGEY